VEGAVLRFWYKDKKLRGKVSVQCSPEEFVERWSQHIPERYRHAVRSFGLFAPRGMQKTLDAVFAILGKSDGHGLSLDAGPNQSCEISNETRCWTRKASD